MSVKSKIKQFFAKVLNWEISLYHKWGILEKEDISDGFHSFKELYEIKEKYLNLKSLLND